MSGQLLHELVSSLDLQRVVGESLNTDGGGFVGAHIATAERACAMRRINDHVVGKDHQLVMEAVVHQAGQLLGRLRRR